MIECINTCCELQGYLSAVQCDVSKGYVIPCSDTNPGVGITFRKAKLHVSSTQPLAVRGEQSHGGGHTSGDGIPALRA